MLVRPGDLADRMSSTQQPAKFTLHQSKAVVENWRQPPDGQIEFTMRHLTTAD
jgi:hypothetical protein